MFANPVYS